MVTRGMGTHWSERLSACGRAAKNDIWIVILVNTEKTLECWFIAEAAR